MERQALVMMEAIWDEISADPFGACGRIFIYGAGVQSREAIRYFEKRGKEIFLADSSERKWGQQAGGHVIMEPKEMMERLTPDDKIVIGAVFHQYEIAVQLMEKWNIPKEQLYTYTCEIFEEDVYCQELAAANREKIARCFEMLADEESKRYYANSLRGRLSRRPYYLQPNPKMKRTGIYGDDLVGYRKNDTILDCGAFTGDTAEMYYDALGGECRIIAVEPFPANYEKMAERLRARGIEKNIVCRNTAVGDKKEKSYIACEAQDNPMGMSVGAGQGDVVEIQVETIDSLLAEELVHYIKMDVEGWELKALQGARHVLQRDRPRLMISAYHKLSDFWELPLFLKSVVPEYRIYAGHAPGVSLEMEFYLTI